jgi:hypothetical protein
MNVNDDPINTLLANVAEFHKTNFELVKLKAIDKTADVISTLASRAFLLITVSIILMTLTITASLWLGELLGKTYYGFLLVSLVYSMVAVILLVTHRGIKGRISNSIITQILN